MRKYLSAGRQVARIHFKSLLVAGLLAGSVSAQQLPAPIADIPSLPDLPILASPPELSATLPVVTAPKWTAGQHAAWILGLRVRTKGLPATSMTVGMPAQTMLPTPPESAAADIALPGPTGDSMVAQVQFVDQGLPEVPEALRSPGAAKPLILAVKEATPFAPVESTPKATQTESRRIGSGPIMAAPVAALPLDEQTTWDLPAQGESLLSVDVSGIDPAALNTLEPPATIDESLIDGLVMPQANTGTSSDESYRLRDKPSRSPANVAIHESFTPRKVDEIDLPPIVDGSTKDHDDETESSQTANRRLATTVEKSTDSEPASELKASPALPLDHTFANRQSANHQADGQSQLSAPSLIKPLPHWDPVEDSTVAVVTPAQGSPEPASVEPTTPELSNADTPISDLASSSEPALPKRLMSASEQVLSESPLVNSIVEADVAKPASSRQSTSDVALAVAPKWKNETNKPTPGRAHAASEEVPEAPMMVSAKLIAGEAPAGSLPIVAAPQMKFTEAKTDRTRGRGTASAVKTASATLPDDELTIDGQEQVSYSRLAAKLTNAVKQKFPDSRVRITSNEDGLVVDGVVADSGEATKIMAFVRKTSLCPAVDRLSCKR